MTSFVKRIQAWQQQSGRHHLPWQGTTDPYKVWLSEIMLQQTQVSTVIDYYLRFLKKFPSVTALANTPVEEVMPYWAGLGYYARARNLHKCAQIVATQYKGLFPSQASELQKLPGIGESTANSIAAFCFHATTPIMDGNVKRVFTRFYGIEGYGAKTDKQLWEQAYKNVMGEQQIGQYNQGLMDLGSMVCTRSKPKCQECPLRPDCYAFKYSKQAVLPSKKPKKIIPQRETIMLIIRTQHKVLLQKRPAQGIWGGLLSLPELTNEAELNTWLTEHPTLHAQKMASFEHIFSHYRLLIHPVRISATTTLQDSARLAITDTQWYPLSDISSLALPSPVMKLLSTDPEL
ncbi:A/G-specific adenine glycosylase [Pelistega suis]|uniref:Adenine DNA glycosylase n=1 Tax=Pelistega suis TaxID=1631957 RepID=A0A849P4V0_9BURK|nr:A/G-specific adenine glycosylase [Pelistega suis]NOL50755.1 A/G-specific adenine glycosylase [Pelistega suis]